MKKYLLGAALALLVVSATKAQTHVFTVNGGLSGYYQTNYRNSNPQPSSAPCISPNVYCEVGITGWDGVPCPENELCGYNGGTQAGAVQLTAQPTVSGLILPYQLGYPNNGFLPQDCTLVYGGPVYTRGNGLNLGDSWSYSGSAICTGYAEGVSWNVTLNYAVTRISNYCGRGGCAKTYTYQLISGSGTIQGPKD